MYTQQHRLLKVHSPAFAENTFLLTAFSGEEALSKPFEFELTLISQVVDIKADTLLGQTITIVIDTGINAPRVFNGYMVQVLESPHKASGFSEYTIKVVPWFWYSHLTSGTQRFEGKSVVQIFTEVCRGLGCYDFDTRQLHQSYAPVAVVVQYNETVLDFLSRILCEARIDYRFTHTQETHTLVLIDSVCERLTSPIDWLRSDDKRQWCRTKRWATPQREAFPTSAVSSSPFSIPTETRIQGISQSPVLTPGYRVSLADAPSDDDEMVIVSVTHQARDNSVLTGQAVELSAVYSNTVCGTLALSGHQATTVTAPGSDVAMIVGHHDKHIDADTHGRVKSHFYWQTEDHPSSRQRLEVLQPIAGADWGMQFLPRQGDEALVRYIQGDPKQPIVLGSVYNGVNLPFYPLPAAHTTTGIVTCRVGGEAMGSSHRLTFDDSHGQERFTLASSGDFTIQSRQHLTQTIDATQHHHIKGKMTAITEGTQTIDSHRSLRLMTPSGNGIVMHDRHIILQGATIQLGQPGEGQKPLMDNPIEQRYWLTLQYPRLTRPPSSTQVRFQWPVGKDTQTATSELNRKGFAGVHPTPSTAIPTTLALTQGLLISVKGRPLAYPRSTVKVSEQDWTPATAKALPGVTISAQDKHLTADVIFPPIIINLRADAPPGSATTLTPTQLAYLNVRGKNVTIFVHGYNVPLGRFSREVTQVDIQPLFGPSQPKVGIGPFSSKVLSADAILTDTTDNVTNTLCRHPAQMTDHFGVRFPAGDDDLILDEFETAFNGTQAHNWWLHMEDNLNRATGQFDGSDYTQYQRCVQVAWQGDTGLVDFGGAEANADSAGIAMVPLLRQLLTAGLSVNLISHSLGARVVLRALDSLGRKPSSALIEQVFLWEAAVPNSSLSNDRHKSEFPYAHAAAKRFTVLYNGNDEVLWLWYWLDKHVVQASLDTDDYVNDSEAVFKYNAFVDVKQYLVDGSYYRYAGQEAMSGQAITDAQVQQVVQQINEGMDKEKQSMPIDRGRIDWHPALGAAGPDKETQKQLKGKLILANLTPWAEGHSYMKIPDKAIMKHGYETYILNRHPHQGMDAFGCYDKNLFPDYPLPKDRAETGSTT